MRDAVVSGGPAPAPQSGRAPRVWVVCTGVGRVRRGYETYARDLFDRLREDGRVDATLLKGGGATAPGERVVACIHRDMKLNHALRAMLPWHKKYAVEYGSFCLSMLPLLVASPPDVVYAIEVPVYKFLRAWRRATGARYRLVHFTGGQLGQMPPDGSAYLHHVTPCTLATPEAAAFPADRQFVLPHFLDLRSVPEPSDPAGRLIARERLGLPRDRRIVLSVGNLDMRPKRMDYLVREVATLEPRPYLVMLGQTDSDTPQLAALAESLLGVDGHRISTVPRELLWSYYAAADAFALASLREGFGLVYLEALAAGLPVVAHEFDVARFVLGDEGTFADLTQPGSLASALVTVLTQADPRAAWRRRDYVRDRFDWSVLGPRYVRIFQDIARA